MHSFKVSIPNYCKIIAEIGINHNGDIELAKKLILMSKNSGCDLVKFQKRDIETVYTKKFLAEYRKSPWGNTQRDQKKGLEFTEKDYDILDAYCKELNIGWFASAWDINSLDFLDKYKLKNHKVASAMISNENFLKSLSKRKKHTYISTGISSKEMIESAVKIFKENNCSFTLMHSISTYPCKEENLNLINIIKLKEKYGCEVGYSGHESSPGPSVIAASFGADCIERHITLDRSMYGSDQSSSLEQSGLRLLVGMVRKIPTMIGKERTAIYDFEEEVAKKLRYWEN